MKYIFSDDPDLRASKRVKSKNTFANYPCAKLKAHSLKYEAVLETVPRTNSIDSISEWIICSPKSNSSE